VIDVPGVDLDRLRSTLAGPLEVTPADLSVEVIEGGRSNLTYRLTAGTRAWVLRRPPLGHVLATAHDMAREYRVMTALRPAGVRVPEMLYFETDTDLIGAPFFVMEFVDGLVVRSDADAALISAEDARRAGDELVDQLVALHRVDPEAAGLASLGRPVGYLQRQVTRWQRQWADSRGAATGQPLDELGAQLIQRLPGRPGSAIVHGDYRLDNTILDAGDHGRVAAIIDWEMATLGDPLADLGLLLTYWSPLSARVTGAGHPVSTNHGFPDGAYLARRYEQVSESVIEDLAFYEAFGHFKLAVIAQTIHARYLQGLTVGPEFASAGTAVTDLIARGRELLSS
jgi:aminoglycoside phosphotransferase (APT) family kinase protein